MSDFVAVFAVDPGRVTGVARGVFPIADAETVAEAYARGVGVESWECNGAVRDQAQEIVEEAADWFADLHLFRSMPLTDLRLVVEDFKLRTRNADLTPVELAAAIDAGWSWQGVPILRQQPSQAKGYATDDRLRQWGAWVVGSTHRRDAVRHVLTRLSTDLG